MRKLIKKRFNAFLIDIAILGAFEIFILVVLMIISKRSFLFNYSLTTAITFSLFFCKDVINGQSIGKRIFKLQVVSEKGDTTSLKNIILRNVIALLQPIDILYIVNNKGKRLGDIICKTKVISGSEKNKYRCKFFYLIGCYIIVLFITFSFLFLIWIIVIGKIK